MTHAPDPTPDEIAERKAAIQADWDDAEYRRRAGLRTYTGWTPPERIVPVEFRTLWEFEE